MTDLTPEQVRKLWTDALRSGEYKQGRRQLRDGDEFCCLGVLCELAVAHGVITSYDPTAGVLYLVPEVAKWVGLANTRATYGVDGQLTEDNDCGVPFHGIADIIDLEPPGLFVDDER